MGFCRGVRFLSDSPVLDAGAENGRVELLPYFSPELVLHCIFRVQDKELRDIRDRVQDKEGELDTLRKAGKNLRERLDEKEVETRGIMDRVRAPPGHQCICSSETVTSMEFGIY